MPAPIQAAPSNDFKTILEEVAKEAFKGRRPIRSVGTDAGTTTTWRAADEFMGTSPRQYDGVTLHVLTDDGAAPPGNVDQARLITAFDNIDQFTLQTAFTAFTPAASDVALLYYGAGADQMKHAVNKTLKNFQVPKIEPATLVPDGNMAQSGVTGFTALGAAGAPVKDTTYALFGSQSLKGAVLIEGKRVDVVRLHRIPQRVFLDHRGRRELEHVVRQAQAVSDGVVRRNWNHDRRTGDDDSRSRRRAAAEGRQRERDKQNLDSEASGRSEVSSRPDRW